MTPVKVSDALTQQVAFLATECDTFTTTRRSRSRRTKGTLSCVHRSFAPPDPDQGCISPDDNRPGEPKRARLFNFSETPSYQS
jgi:hypothetical protein